MGIGQPASLKTCATAPRPMLNPKGNAECTWERSDATNGAFRASLLRYARSKKLRTGLLALLLGAFGRYERSISGISSRDNTKRASPGLGP